MIQELLQNKKTNKNNRSFNFFSKNTLKISLKIIRYLLFAFLIVIAVYGCAQQFFDTNVRTYPTPGAGFEICGPNENDCFSNHVIINGNYEIDYNVISTFADAIKLGPFYGLFVWPIAQLEAAMLTGISTQGWGVLLSILFLVFIIRFFVLSITFTQIKQQFKMQILQTKIAEIKGKYPNSKKDQLQRQKLQLDLMRFYKKHNLKPIGSIIGSVATLPFFYAIYRVIASMRYIKEASLGPFQMSVSPLTAIMNGSLVYIVIAIMVIIGQVVAFKLPNWLNKTRQQKKLMDAGGRKQLKTTNLVTTIMIVVFAVIAISVPTALCFYWTFSSVFTAAQNYFLFLARKHHQKFNFRKQKPIEKQLIEVY